MAGFASIPRILLIKGRFKPVLKSVVTAGTREGSNVMMETRVLVMDAATTAKLSLAIPAQVFGLTNALLSAEMASRLALKNAMMAV